MFQYTPTSYPQYDRPSFSGRNYHQFMKDQLARENSAQLNQKKNLEVRPSLNSLKTVVEQKTTRPVSSKSQNTGVKSQLSAKISEIMKLCQDDKRQLTREFQDIQEGERKVFDLLANEQHSDHQRESRRRTPTQSEINKGYRISAIDKLKSDRNQYNFQNLKEQLRHKNAVGQDILEMIEGIERKALIQIQSLKREKIDILKKLNEEIKAHQEEKKMRTSLQWKVQEMTQKNIINNDGFEPFYQPSVNRTPKILEENPQNLKRRFDHLLEENKRLKTQTYQYEIANSEHQQLRSQISALERKITEYQVQIAELKANQKNNKQLFEQGQSLRMETLSLLRKQGLANLPYEKIIQQLQQKLMEEQKNKKQILGEGERFKEKIRFLQEQNKFLKRNNTIPTKINTNSSTYDLPRRPYSYYPQEKINNQEYVFGDMKKFPY